VSGIDALAAAPEAGIGGAGAEAEDPVAGLVDQARRGSEAAFERLYRLHASQAYGLCLRLTGDRTEAEALTQEVFVRMWRKLDTYEGRGPLGAWLRSLAVHLLIDNRRRAARGPRLDADDGAMARASIPPRRVEETLDLERAIARLPRGARLAFVLHDVEGYRHQEIAEQLGVATGTVKAQLHRARRLLRAALAPPGGVSAR